MRESMDFEKMGIFYLGRIVNPGKPADPDNLLLYESKNFTTHAVCLGMTGSGKTGLGISIIEEAAIDKIPSIVIDPKGDLGNLLLTFPNLTADEFLPWIDGAEAERKDLALEDYAQSVAGKWKEGLKEWGEGPERIKALREAVDFAIYTPASQAGIPLSILSSFKAPPKDLLNTGEFRDRILSTTSSLLGLIGLNADPLKSREHIFISTIITKAWEQGKNVDIPLLIEQVQKPPFNKIGVLDVDTFFPEKERMSLSINLNNLLASPGFHAWMEGEPLDIQKLLYASSGKPKVSVISIAHLSDAERMFFVTLLLNQLVTWMRRQPGTSSLRALLYMDEIFGYFPPTSMPPSKTPMLTLLKQARAYGLGIVLTTQNPADLDYKGLSNCGTWFIGKLQTERDKARVLEGLNVASNGEFDANSLNEMIAATGNRTFIMRSIYEQQPILFQTRWTLSYLRGPLTLAQIAKLTTKPKIENIASQIPKNTNENAAYNNDRPILQAKIEELFVRRQNIPSKVIYKPFVIGLAKLHYVDSKRNIDTWQDVCILAKPTNDGSSINWEEGKIIPQGNNILDKEPQKDCSFEPLPAGLMKEKNYALFQKTLTSWLYQTQTYPLYQATALKITSNKDESESDFRIRVSLLLREKRDEKVRKLQETYSAKIKQLTDKLDKARTKLATQQQKSGLQKAETLLSFGTTVLGAIFGGKINKGTISSAGTSIRKAGKITQESQNVANTEEDYKRLQQQLDQLQEEMQNEISHVEPIEDPTKIDLETVEIRPRKTDITIDKVALAWIPE